MNPDPPILDFMIALFIGALVGIEREKRKADEHEPGIGGLRTFILLAEAGALGAWFSQIFGNPWLFLFMGFSISLLVIAGYLVATRRDGGSIGLTTEVAAIVVFMLGGVTILGERSLAVALAIVTSALLAFKRPLHGMVEKIGQEDLYAGLKLLIATFIVLPVLPNRYVDPWNALNPYKTWWLVILISALSLVGYVASRWLGSGRGIPLTGLFGGLVSSTAVTLSFARRSRDEAHLPHVIDALASGLLLAWVVMFGRVIVEVAVVNRELLAQLIWPMLMMGLAAAAMALLHLRGGLREGAARAAQDVELRNPFSLTSAIKFAAFFTAIMIAVKLVQIYFPGRNFYAIAALAGLTDVDAITLSMAEYAAKGGDADMAVNSIVIAALTNTLVKLGLVLQLGAARLRRSIGLATAVLLAVGLGILLLHSGSQ